MDDPCRWRVEGSFWSPSAKWMKKTGLTLYFGVWMFSGRSKGVPGNVLAGTLMPLGTLLETPCLFWLAAALESVRLRLFWAGELTDCSFQNWEVPRIVFLCDTFGWYLSHLNFLQDNFHLRCSPYQVFFSKNSTREHKGNSSLTFLGFSTRQVEPGQAGIPHEARNIT